MTQKLDIGAAIIAKNNAKTLTNTLKSLVKVMRQIVVVDTGSNDATPSIATRFGAEIYFHSWQDDFSIARNRALSYMHTDWILSIDTDECLQTDNFLSIENLLDDQTIGGISVELDNLISDTDPSNFTIHRFTRIFRNLPFIRYSGKIHEQIADSILNNNLSIAESSIKIIHSGYLHTDKEKIERNRKLLLDELDTSNNPDWTKFHLASTEFASKNFQKAEEIFSEILDSSHLTPEQNELTRIRLAQIALRSDATNKIPNLLNFSACNASLEGFRRFILGSYFITLHDFATGIKILKTPEVTSSPLVNKEMVSKIITTFENHL